MTGFRTALEAGFPSAMINQVAEQESWRKEVTRPTYHFHKWWANRLGSVFRAILIAALSPEGADVARLFYEPTRFPDAVVLDPMMGSGTTIGEALKLGCRVVGQDINPVSYLQVRAAVSPCDLGRLERAYQNLAATVAPVIASFFSVPDPYEPGSSAQSLYSFWVKRVNCPRCAIPVRLFSSYTFARHAYTKRFPSVRSLCLTCGEINGHNVDEAVVHCRGCGESYSPEKGPVRGAYAVCSAGHRFKILDALEEGEPPQHELFASLVRTQAGRKEYVRARPDDLAGVERAEIYLANNVLPVPDERIDPGYNTDQLRSYGYRFWRQLFTARQLVGLGLLTRAVAAEPDPAVRLVLALLVSGTVEFNNLLCTYKGEGTGAVRPAFSNHILKPERTPIENTVWGLPESSGCFSTLYHSRLTRALGYRQRPFELRVVDDPAGNPVSEKVYGLSARMSVGVTPGWANFARDTHRALITCGDARQIPIPDGVVDAIVTDPPYFDFVHYSELADLFQGWLRLMVSDLHPACALPSTRQPGEIQQQDPLAFSQALGDVLTECARVLKPHGLLTFSFHHSRDEAWAALGSAIFKAGLAVVAAHPVKAEMSVAAPKAGASEAIDIDAILVCKHLETVRSPDTRATVIVDRLISEILGNACVGASAYQATVKRVLTRGDLRVILQGECLKVASKFAGHIVSATAKPVSTTELVQAAGASLEQLFVQVQRHESARDAG